MRAALHDLVLVLLRLGWAPPRPDGASGPDADLHALLLEVARQRVAAEQARGRADDAIERSWALAAESLLARLTSQAALEASQAARADRRDDRSWPGSLRRAVAAIDADPATPLDLPALSRTVGVTPRALQAAFSRHVGCTPSAYLRRVRLQHAHADLVGGAGEPPRVAEVAARWGYSNAGRFAADYRATYGVTPSSVVRT
ncbi:hypothetical protein GCM10025868_01150 [Angustibacter aerolatus]|uniref:HTH araC/xylS-type domain-containing protein n=1 Tax=Angustibacter aerolatus TaxID=1162965 RepID=A0ABQ6JDF0_9ACTN|nr:helix-turn-helix transcriptional regulator [Angustibacter aerolatus]GMA84865.1 hypothetical protein GCM10025868_01150 [Angustibacter aerolatus]